MATALKLRRELPAALLILSLVAIVVAGIYLKFDRPVAFEQQVGTLESMHQVQGNTGSNYSLFYVRLASGELVSVLPPEMTPFLKGRRVRVIQHTRESRRMGYAFAGYEESASNPTADTDARKSGARGSP
jgi:hypothetical protein